MSVYHCIGNDKRRVVEADDETAAAAKCMEVYGYHPDQVVLLEKGVDYD